MPWREKVPERNDYRNPVVAEAMKEMKYVNMFLFKARFCATAI